MAVEGGADGRGVGCHDERGGRLGRIGHGPDASGERPMRAIPSTGVAQSVLPGLTPSFSATDLAISIPSAQAAARSSQA